MIATNLFYDTNHMSVVHRLEDIENPQLQEDVNQALELYKQDNTLFVEAADRACYNIEDVVKDVGFLAGIWDSFDGGTNHEYYDAPIVIQRKRGVDVKYFFQDLTRQYPDSEDYPDLVQVVELAEETGLQGAELYKRILEEFFPSYVVVTENYVIYE